MACRCEDIAIMERDMERLEEALKIVKEMDDDDTEIDNNLGDMSEKFPDTLIIPDTGVYAKMCGLHTKCQNAIADMYSNISTEKGKLSDELINARLEDAAYHLAHPVETVEGWFGG